MEILKTIAGVVASTIVLIIITSWILWSLFKLIGKKINTNRDSKVSKEIKIDRSGYNSWEHLELLIAAYIALYDSIDNKKIVDNSAVKFGRTKTSLQTMIKKMKYGDGLSEEGIGCLKLIKESGKLGAIEEIEREIDYTTRGSGDVTWFTELID